MSTDTRHQSRSATRSTRSDKPATRRASAIRSAAISIVRGPEVFAHYTLGSMVLLVNMVRFGAELREDPQS